MIGSSMSAKMVDNSNAVAQVEVGEVQFVNPVPSGWQAINILAVCSTDKQERCRVVLAQHVKGNVNNSPENPTWLISWWQMAETSCALAVWLIEELYAMKSIYVPFYSHCICMVQLLRLKAIKQGIFLILVCAMSVNALEGKGVASFIHNDSLISGRDGFLDASHSLSVITLKPGVMSMYVTGVR